MGVRPGEQYLYDETPSEKRARERAARSEPTEAMVNAGAHVLSEWLDDMAPLNERRYREPARSAFKAMLAAKGDKP